MNCMLQTIYGLFFAFENLSEEDIRKDYLVSIVHILLNLLNKLERIEKKI